VAPASPAQDPPAQFESADRFEKWRQLTVALIVTGYAGYYLCRSDFAVALPLLIAEMGRRGIAPGDARIRLGTVASLGVLAYAIGKFPSGWLADFLGGRRNFLFGMAGSSCSPSCSVLPAAFPSLRLRGWVIG